MNNKKSPLENIKREIAKARSLDLTSELREKLEELIPLINDFLWGEELFCYTPLGPNNTGLPTPVLIPSSTLGAPTPFILVLKEGLSFKEDKSDYFYIPLNTTKKIRKDIRRFIEINQYAITKHWAQLTDSVELVYEIKKI